MSVVTYDPRSYIFGQYMNPLLLLQPNFSYHETSSPILKNDRQFSLTAEDPQPRAALLLWSPLSFPKYLLSPPQCDLPNHNEIIAA